MFEIKQVNRSNFTENSMDSFDRYQEVQNVFRMENGRLVLKKQPFAETWSPERRREKAAEILSEKYITYCAFDGDTVIGEIMQRRSPVSPSFANCRAERKPVKNSGKKKSTIGSGSIGN